MNNVKIKESDYKEMIKLYESGKSMKDIAKIYKVTAPCIKYNLLKNNIQLNTNRIYTFNEDYFEKIDSDNKAYFLGYLFADGCIRERFKKGRNNPIYSCILKLHEKDYYIMEYFKKELNFNGGITKEKGTNCFKIVLNSKKLCKDLINLGCIPCKSLILKFPKMLNKEYYPHFIRGYFDGDGSVGVYDQKYRTDFISNISLLGTLDFCRGVKEELENNNIKAHIKKRGKNIKNTYCLNVYAREQQIKFINYIYKDAVYYLIRKYKISLDIIRLYEFRFKFKENSLLGKVVNKFIMGEVIL